MPPASPKDSTRRSPARFDQPTKKSATFGLSHGALRNPNQAFKHSEIAGLAQLVVLCT
jgi:hypothetical protein